MTPKDLKPLGQYILLKFLKTGESKSGTIYLGANADQGPQTAVVIALGSGADSKGDLVPFEVKVDDVVYVSRHTAGVELKDGGEVYCLVKEEGLLGVVEEA